jgi:3-hydroxyacyl-CoA dehydrogenase/enoyl-CoA hydratase/3-hydroxybutyryl-CoA epimerase
LRGKFGEISPTVEYSGFRYVDMVVEAVVEKLEIKQKVLSDVEARIGTETVFASNTSSLPIGDIAAHARYPERVVGLHFFNPVHRMPLVEVIAGPRSSPEAIATTHAFALRLGKVPVVVKDGPGFLVNRLLMFYMIEAIRLLEEGVRIDALDRAVKSFGMPMGPFELLDVVGLDTSRHVAGVLQSAFSDRIGTDRTLLDTMVEQGRLGQKSGRGFWRWKDGKKVAAETEVYRFAGDPTPREVPPETLEERVILTMVNEAARCLDEGVVATPTDIDLAMVMGTGFPPFRGGLLRYADSVGVPVVADRLARLSNAHGERLAPADRLQRMVREQRRFYG